MLKIVAKLRPPDRFICKSMMWCLIPLRYSMVWLWFSDGLASVNIPLKREEPWNLSISLKFSSSLLRICWAHIHRCPTNRLKSYVLSKSIASTKCFSEILKRKVILIISKIMVNNQFTCEIQRRTNTSKTTGQTETFQLMFALSIWFVWDCAIFELIKWEKIHLQKQTIVSFNYSRKH